MNWEKADEELALALDRISAARRALDEVTAAVTDAAENSEVARVMRHNLETILTDLDLVRYGLGTCTRLAHKQAEKALAAPFCSCGLRLEEYGGEHERCLGGEQ